MSTSPQRLVAAVDIGTTAVKAIVAEGTGDARDPGARILGVGMERCAGVRRGVVRDIEETTRAIRKAMRDAERMAGVEVGAILCGIAGEHVAGQTSTGVVSITGGEIRTGDVARVNDVASSVPLGRDHELLHLGEFSARRPSVPRRATSGSGCRTRRYGRAAAPSPRRCGRV